MTLRTLRRNIAQQTPVTPGQTDRLPLRIPSLSACWTTPARKVVATATLETDRAQQTFTADGLASKPPSILRDFSLIWWDVHAAEQTFLLTTTPRPNQPLGRGPFLP
jgi:aminopeptidase N